MRNIVLPNWKAGNPMRHRIAKMFCDFVIGDCKSHCNCKDASSLRTKRHFCPPFPDGYRGQPCEEHGSELRTDFCQHLADLATGCPSRPSPKLPLLIFRFVVVGRHKWFALIRCLRTCHGSREVGMLCLKESSIRKSGSQILLL